MYTLVHWQTVEMCELEKPAKKSPITVVLNWWIDLEVGQNGDFYLLFFYGGAQVIPTAHR